MSIPEITNALRAKYTPFQIKKLEDHIPVILDCKLCGQSFDAQSYVFRPTAIYPRINEFCSPTCVRMGAGRKNKKVFRNYICEQCGTTYEPNKSKVHQRFCSIHCRSNYLKNKPRPEIQRWIHKIVPPAGSISNQEVEWLKQFTITHYQHVITINNRSYRVDGYNDQTNTIYEYLGSFWHGNPAKYDPNDINPRNKISFGQLYENTTTRLSLFEEHGYNVVVEWSDR